MNYTRTILTIVCLCLTPPALAQSPKLADGKRRQFSLDIRLTDVLNHRWVDELVTYTLDFPAKQATLNSIRLYDVDHGKEAPFQLSKVVSHDERQQFVKSADIAFFVDELPAEGKRTYTVLWDLGAFASATQPAAALRDANPQLAGESAFLLPDSHERKQYLSQYVNRNLADLRRRLDQHGHLLAALEPTFRGDTHNSGQAHERLLLL